jgi:transcription antitermination factor NusG
MKPAWYAVYTKHQHEKSAKVILEGKGFEVLLPLYQTARRWKDRRQTVTMPIFPAYLFLRTRLERKVDVLRTPGIFWFVETAGQPSVVPEGDIELIARISENPDRAAPHRYLRTGERVRVCSGPLRGIEGILSRTRNHWRVVVAVDLLRQSAAVEVDADTVEPVAGPRQSTLSPRT